MCAAPADASISRSRSWAFQEGTWACPACLHDNPGSAVECQECFFPDNLVVLDSARIPLPSPPSPPSSASASAPALSLVLPVPIEYVDPGTTLLPDEGGVVFRVWAPSASRVTVAGSFNAWSPTSCELIPEPDEEHFSGLVPDAAPGDSYKYVVFVQDDRSDAAANGNEVPLWRNDPCGRFLSVVPSDFPGHAPEGTVVPASPKAQQRGPPEPGVAPPRVGICHDIILDPNAYQWQDANWTRRPFRELVLYELHVGGFTEQGTWASAQDRLGYLVSLGVNAIQLLPPTQDAHEHRCWGYDPLSLYSPHDTYGSPNEMKAFVDAAHGLGLAVFMDWVPNHLSTRSVVRNFDTLGDPEGRTRGPYFYEDPELRETPYGPRPDLSKPQVQGWLIRSALMWLNEYHLDGLRVDSTGTLREDSRKAGSSSHGAGADLIEAWEFMQELTAAVRTQFPDRILIAEDLRGEMLMLAGGAGFHTQWSHFWFSVVFAQMRLPSDYERSMDALARAVSSCMLGKAETRIIYVESHDTIPCDRDGRMPEAIQPGGTSFFAVQRTLLANFLLFTSPGIPMITVGQELLQTHADAWPLPPRLEWDRVYGMTGEVSNDDDDEEEERRERTLRSLHTFQVLIGLRQNKGGTTAGLLGDHTRVYHVNNAANVMAYHRFQNGGRGDDVVAVVNVSNTTYDGYTLGVPRSGVWWVRCNTSGDGDGDGEGDGPFVRYVAEPGVYDGYPFRIDVTISRYSGLILSQ